MAKIRDKFFTSAEIAEFSKEERIEHQASLEYHRDIKNIADTSFQEGFKSVLKPIVKNLIDMEMSIEDICKVTGLSEVKVKELMDK